MIEFFRGYCFSLKETLEIILFFKDIDLIHNSSWRHPFNEWPFFYYKSEIAAMHSFPFTVLLQNRDCSKELSYLVVMIPRWFQVCICQKK